MFMVMNEYITHCNRMAHWFLCFLKFLDNNCTLWPRGISYTRLWRHIHTCLQDQFIVGFGLSKGFEQTNTEHYQLVAYHCILAPVRQAVVHCDLLPFGDVSDCYDNQPHLCPTVDFSNPAVGWRMEEDRSPNTTRSLLPQLWHTGKYNVTLAISIPKLKKHLSTVTMARVLLTRAEWDQGGSRDCQVEGGGLLHPLGTGHHLGQSGLFKSSTS